MPELLEDLDSIAWEKLNHAYGPAEDVPGLIRDLTSPEQSVRREAWWALYGNIWHQGAVYEATAYAVPFFVELLRHESIHDKQLILTFLAHLGCGQSYTAARRDLLLFADARNTPEFQEQMRRELRWVQDTRDAVGRGVDVYLPFLDDDIADLRVTAAYALACCADSSVRVTSRMRLVDHVEHDDTVRATLMLCIGYLDDGARENARYLSEVARFAEPDSVRLAALLSLAHIAGERLPDFTLRLLIRLLDNHPLFLALNNQHTQLVEMAFGPLTHLLRRLSARQIEPIIPVLAKMLVVEEDVLCVAQAMIELAFRERVIGEGETIRDLTPIQRFVLMTIAYNDALWAASNNMEAALRQIGIQGLPKRKALLEFLEDGA